ncbi:hypothetical protein CKO24_11545 [Rhodothalassium salexigens DSM 2132]|nr:hypothetical protein [Rhodothalassium salexigens DSM 2132]
MGLDRRVRQVHGQAEHPTHMHVALEQGDEIHGDPVGVGAFQVAGGECGRHHPPDTVDQHHRPRLVIEGALPAAARHAGAASVGPVGGGRRLVGAGAALCDQNPEHGDRLIRRDQAHELPADGGQSLGQRPRVAGHRGQIAQI